MLIPTPFEPEAGFIGDIMDPSTRNTLLSVKADQKTPGPSLD